MGAASITVLAPAQILRITGSTPAGAVRTVIRLAVIFRALAACLIPPLAARGAWPPAAPGGTGAPLRYRPDLWMIVLPASMYATATCSWARPPGR